MKQNYTLRNCVFILVCLLFVLNNAHAAHMTVKEITELCSLKLLEVESTLTNGEKVVSTGINLTPGGLFLTTGAFINAKKAKVRSPRLEEWSDAKPIHFEIHGVMALGKVWRGETPTVDTVPQLPAVPATGTRVNVISFKDRKSGRCLVSRNVIGKRCMPFAEAGGKAQAIFKYVPVYKLEKKIDSRCYGGVVADEKGNALGMASAILGNGKNCYFVVPMAVIRAYMEAMNSPKLKKVHRALLPYLDKALEIEKQRFKMPDKLRKSINATAALFIKRTMAGKKQCLKWQDLRDLRMGIAPADASKRAARKKAIAALHKKYPQWPYEVAQCINDKWVVPGMTEKQALLVGKLMEKDSTDKLKLYNPGGAYIIFTEVSDGVIYNVKYRGCYAYCIWADNRKKQAEFNEKFQMWKARPEWQRGEHPYSAYGIK